MKLPMAIGFPAKYEKTVEMHLDRAVLREAIEGVLDTLGWSYRSDTADEFTARAPLTGFSWGERVTIHLSYDGVVSVKSKCEGVMFQIFDWGKNKQNVDSFFDLLAVKAPRVSLVSSLDEKQYFDKDGKTPLQRALANDEGE